MDKLLKSVTHDQCDTKPFQLPDITALWLVPARDRGTYLWMTCQRLLPSSEIAGSVYMTCYHINKLNKLYIYSEFLTTLKLKKVSIAEITSEGHLGLSVVIQVV